MKQTKIYTFLALFLAVFIISSCHKDLDKFPTNDLTADKVFVDLAGYKNALSKLYVSLAVTGTNGRDIPSEIVSDEGNTGFIRQLWYLQSLTTDEGLWTWSGNTDPVNMHEMNWSSNSYVVAGLYFRCYYLIATANNFIAESSDAKLAARGITGADAEQVKQFRAEARFIRAFSYATLLDHFGAVPFTDENYVIGSGVSPKQLSKQEIFSFVESELTAIDPDLVAPKTNENGRADKAAAWALLSRIYLNANIYIGTPKYTEAIAASKKVIDAGYTLHNDYTQLMLADNHTLVGSEFIWSIRFDATQTQSYSGTTFLVHGPSGVSGEVSGSNGSWNCIRITEDFVDKFNAADIRGQFWTTGQTKTVASLLGDPTSGYSSSKFRNVDRNGNVKPGSGNPFVDIDFPVFRLAEIYLNYAEAVMRGGTGGDNATALNYLKALARRARPTAGAAADAVPTLTEDYLIDERGRELFWEGHRRTDLIRFGMFTTSKYLWDWKGNVRNGTAVDSKYNVFPIPSIDITSNPSINQNTGY